MKKVLQLKKVDIRQGRAGRSDSCPIARALKRGYPKIQDIHVFGDSVRYWKPNAFDFSRAGLSKKLQRFIRRFDHHKPVKPFKFAISL